MINTPFWQSLVQMIPLVLSGLAICVAVATAIFSSDVAERLSSSDHHAAEQVKSDTAKLIASLKSIADKLALESQGLTVEFSEEQNTLSEFINSATGFAYRAWIRDQQDDPRYPETWKNFFLYMAELSNPHSNPSIYATIDVLHSLQELTDTNLETIHEYNTKLVEAIASMPVDGHHVHGALYLIWKEQKDQDRTALEQLKCLREHGVTDPNIDMHVALDQDDVTLLKKALENGADLSVRKLETLSLYEGELRKFGCT